MLRVDTFSLGALETNCFLVSADGKAVAVDPGGDPELVLDALADQGLTLTHILNTHFHFDHTAGNAALARATGAPILGSSRDAYLLETELGLGGFMGFPTIERFSFQAMEPGRIELLGKTCEVLATPGHSQGSLSFFFPEDGHLFSGDLIFARSVGRTDFPGGSHEILVKSVLDKVFTLPGDTVIHPGHGPDTTVDEEKLHNPFFTAYTR